MMTGALASVSRRCPSATWPGRPLLPFESVAFEAGVALDSQITPDLELLGDPEQLRRLVAILVDNAASTRGRPRLGLTDPPAPRETRQSSPSTTPARPSLRSICPAGSSASTALTATRARSQGGYGLGLSIRHRASSTAIGAGPP